MDRKEQHPAVPLGLVQLNVVAHRRELQRPRQFASAKHGPGSEHWVLAADLPSAIRAIPQNPDHRDGFRCLQIVVGEGVAEISMHLDADVLCWGDDAWSTRVVVKTMTACVLTAESTICRVPIWDWIAAVPASRYRDWGSCRCSFWHEIVLYGNVSRPPRLPESLPDASSPSLSRGSTFAPVRYRASWMTQATIPPAVRVPRPADDEQSVSEPLVFSAVRRSARSLGDSVRSMRESASGGFGGDSGDSRDSISVPFLAHPSANGMISVSYSLAPARSRPARCAAIPVPDEPASAMDPVVLPPVRGCSPFDAAHLQQLFLQVIVGQPEAHDEPQETTADEAPDQELTDSAGDPVYWAQTPTPTLPYAPGEEDIWSETTDSSTVATDSSTVAGPAELALDHALEDVP